MTIEFSCNNCLQPLRVPDTSAGKGARCPKCKAISLVPSAGGDRGPGIGGRESAVGRPVVPPVEQPATTPAQPPFAPPSPNDALFAMLKAATTPQPQPAAQPFVDATRFNPPAKLPGGPPGVNPYASPESAAYAYQPTSPTSGERPGLPWEVEGPGIMSWWQTSQMCLQESSHAFQIMRREGGIGSPLLFAVCGMGIGFLGQALWRLPVLIVGANVNNAGARQDVLTDGLIEIGAGGVATIVAAILLVPIYALMYHLMLMMLGGANHGYETTYRVVAYTHGALAWLQVVPCVGGLIVLVMHFVCLINGLAEAHDTTRGKAAVAVFVPLGVCIAAIVGIAVVVIGAIAAQA